MVLYQFRYRYRLKGPIICNACTYLGSLLAWRGKCGGPKNIQDWLENKVAEELVRIELAYSIDAVLTWKTIHRR